MSTQETEPDFITKSSDNIQVKVTKHANCLVKFEISVTPQAVSASYVKALRNINKEVSIPGFRKGKAPDRLILERYGSSIHKEWVEIVLQVAFNEALHLTHIHPLKDGQVKRPVVHECSQEKGARFTIEFEEKPVIPSVDLSNLVVKSIPLSLVSQQEKDLALEQVLTQLTTYEPIQDRSVQQDDHVNLDVDTLETPSKRIVDNQRVKVNEKEMPDWLREKVIGLKSNETAEGETVAEIGSGQQPIRFKVTVKAIWQGKTPPIDDELAKKVGLQTVDELYQKIEQRLDTEAENERQHKQIQELESVLFENYPIDLPESLLESDKKARLDHYIEQLKKERQDSYFKSNQRLIEEMIDKNSRRALQLFFLLRKVATDNGIDASEEDVSEELNRQITLISTGQSNIDISDKERFSSQIYSLALDHKIKRFLLDKSTFIEG